MYLIIFQRLAVSAFVDIFYFPVWWYSGGMVYAAKRCIILLRRGNQFLAPGLWLANIFVPMFGQFDWQGRIISFFMRFFQIIFRTIALLIWLAICIFLFAVWLMFPIALSFSIIIAIRAMG